MPVDYSKFDNIEDSDEEPPKSSPVIQETFAPPSRTNKGGYVTAPAPKSKSGRELLEPPTLEDKLSICSSGASRGGGGGPPPPASGADPMMGLAEQLERWAGPQGTSEAPKAKPGEPQRLCMRADGMKKIHTTFPDGSEMVEEYDERTDILMLRKTRKASTLGRESEWVIEVGQAPTATFDPHADLMRASASNPIFLRKDTPEHFQWRIRNLTYPANVYSVTIDHEKQDIVVRTSNKKYFKRIDLPDLRRNDVKFKDELLSWKHQHNTLIISYAKPEETRIAEQKALKEAERAALKM